MGEEHSGPKLIIPQDLYTVCSVGCVYTDLENNVVLPQLGQLVIEFFNLCHGAVVPSSADFALRLKQEHDDRFNIPKAI